MTSQAPASCRHAGCAGLCREEGMRAANATYRRQLLAVARRVVVDPHLAEEAVQEAWLRAWRSCSSFDPARGPVLPWLIVITRNVAIDLARSRGRSPFVISHDPRDDQASAAVPTHEDGIVLRAELLAALAEIGPEQRAVIVETVLRDRPHGEVANELGVPPGTLRSRSHYGIRRLRVILDTARAAEMAA